MKVNLLGLIRASFRSPSVDQHVKVFESGSVTLSVGCDFKARRILASLQDALLIATTIAVDASEVIQDGRR